MTEVLVVAGGFIGGLASGLTGFGFGLSSLPLWTIALPPALSSPLVSSCSVVAQAQTLPSIWKSLDFRRLAPFVIAGLIGVPLGVMLLPKISPTMFRMGFGIMLTLTCALLLFLRIEKRRESSRAADAAVGFCGGVLGGLIGLSGVLPTIWAELHGWGKEERRGIFQGFNFSILLFAVISQAVAGILDSSLFPLLLMAVPSSIVGAWIGHWIYGRLDTKAFSRIILWLLMAAGIALVVVRP